MYRLLILLILSCTACENLLVNEEPDNDQLSNFDIYWEDFDNNYSAFIPRNIDWDLTRALNRPVVEAGMAEDDFFKLLSDISLQFKDIHVVLLREGEIVRFDSRTTTSVIALPSIDFYLSNIQQAGPVFTYGRVIGENIGYLRVPSFSGRFTIDDFAQIDNILNDLADTDGLIIDIRSNGGGTNSNQKTLASRLISAPFVYRQSQVRNGPNHNDFTEPVEDMIQPQGPMQYTKPIVLLINSVTASAAEIFSMTLQTQDHITLVGDVTAKGFGNSVWRELPNGWSYRMTTSLVSDGNGLSYEGVGISPDETVLISRQDSLNGKDAQLERAIFLLR